MKHTYTLILFFLSLSLFAQKAQHPLVEKYGGVFAYDLATLYPPTDIDYRIVIDVMMPSSDSSEVNFALLNIARTLNLHGISGIKKEQMDVLAVVHAGAIHSILNNEAYQQRFGIDNPNEALIHELIKAGVKLYVCGQSLLARGYEDAPIHEQVEISISALTVLTAFQMQGYALLRFK